MKKLLWLSGICILTALLISMAGIYKFNYLASQPGYDCDGNKIEAAE